MKLLLSLYLIANIFSYCLFAIDKWKAKNNKWRISEFALLSTAFFGGVGAYLAMQQLRHKTKKNKFIIIVPFFIFLQIIIIIFFTLQ